MWRGLMKYYLEHPVCMSKDGLFRKQFEEALAADVPEAHYLEGLRYACREKDIHNAKKHMLKAVNKVEEAIFGMVMLTLCSGETVLSDFFTEQLLNKPWPEVLQLGDSTLSAVDRMGVTNGVAYAQTWYGPVPECIETHNIYNRCEDCFIYWCSKEFSRRC